METNKGIYSDLAIPPGEYLEEVLEELGMSKNELAKRMGRPASKLSHIFKGEKAITPETAIQLENAVGVPAHVWIRLESQYRLTLARQADIERLEQKNDELSLERILITKFCYRKLVEIGEIEKHSKPHEKIQALRNYFGVTSLNSVMGLPRYQTAFRLGNAGGYSPEAVVAWLRLGERRAQKMACAPFDRNKLQGSLRDLRSMTLSTPEDFEASLTDTLAECGVVLVICPHFPKTKAHGATFWIGPSKAVLMITIRGNWADIFWFSLFHEIGHILLHDQSDVILENDIKGQKEEEANEFAADVLIPPDEYAKFAKKERFYSSDINAFADDMGIAPGIVVGRLHHDGKLEHQFCNDLRILYKWAYHVNS